jgi:hypothetical protein
MSTVETYLTHRAKHQIFVGGTIRKAGWILGRFNRQVCRRDSSSPKIQHLASGILEGGTTHEQLHHHCHVRFGELQEYVLGCHKKNGKINDYERNEGDESKPRFLVSRCIIEFQIPNHECRIRHIFGAKLCQTKKSKILMSKMYLVFSFRTVSR